MGLHYTQSRGREILLLEGPNRGGVLFETDRFSRILVGDGGRSSPGEQH